MERRRDEYGRKESMQVIILLETRLTARLTQPQKKKEEGGMALTSASSPNMKPFANQSFTVDSY